MTGVHGSRAYGTNREDSDWDIRGIFDPTKLYTLGFSFNTEKAQSSS